MVRLPEARMAEAKARKPFRVASLKTALRLVWQSAPRLTVASILLTLVQSLPSTLTIYLNKLIIDAVVAGMRSADKIASGQQVLLLIAITGGVMLLDNLLSEISDVIRNAQSEMVTNHVSAIVHSKAITVDLEAYENPRYYDTLSRVQRDAAYRPNQVVRNLMQVAQGSVNLLAV